MPDDVIRERTTDEKVDLLIAQVAFLAARVDALEKNAFARAAPHQPDPIEVREFLDG